MYQCTRGSFYVSKIPYFRYCINEKIPISLHLDNLANVILVYCLVIYESRSVAMIGFLCNYRSGRITIFFPGFLPSFTSRRCAITLIAILLMFNDSLGFLALQATKGRAAAWLRQECLMFSWFSLCRYFEPLCTTIKGCNC